jgi:hypothetical protein
MGEERVDADSPPMNYTQIGRQRLKVKLPQYRLELGSHASWLESLLEAYGITTLALEKFRNASQPNIELIHEYESIRNEIERDVEGCLVASRFAKP